MYAYTHVHIYVRAYKRLYNTHEKKIQVEIPTIKWYLKHYMYVESKMALNIQSKGSNNNRHEKYFVTTFKLRRK